MKVEIYFVQTSESLMFIGREMTVNRVRINFVFGSLVSGKIMAQIEVFH